MVFGPPGGKLHLSDREKGGNRRKNYENISRAAKGGQFFFSFTPQNSLFSEGWGVRGCRKGYPP